VWLRDELVGAIRPAIWPLLVTTWFAAHRRAVRPGRPPVAHPETLCPGVAAVIPVSVVVVNLVAIPRTWRPGRPSVGLLADVDSRWG
jgi:hypothetical protein